MRRHLLFQSLILTASLAACSDESPTSPQFAALTPELVAVLDTAINDEYHAEFIYLLVIADFGNVLPFYNVVLAERRHSASLAAVFQRRGLDVPSSSWSTTNVPFFTSLPLACAAASDAEIANIAMYDRFLTLAVPPDVRNVLVANRRASFEKHLPAFDRCR
jgi:hypothetical protein